MELDAARIGGSTPSYQYGLGLLGQYFNQQHARLITIAEVDSGFLLFFFPEGNLRKPRSPAKGLCCAAAIAATRGTRSAPKATMWCCAPWATRWTAARLPG